MVVDPPRTGVPAGTLEALIERPSSPEPPNWKEGGYLDRSVQLFTQIMTHENVAPIKGILGDMLAEEAAKNGWAGLVINGVVRDVDEIGATALGVQALGTCPLKTEKLGMGQRDVPVAFGGVEIRPGDYVYADNNGVLVSEKPLL